MAQVTEYTTIVTSESTCTKVNGQLHSINDQPAMIHADGTQLWYINGKLHRDNDKPAIIYVSGYQAWYVNNNRHRDNDKPAITTADGYQAWYVNGKQHRDNDQPAVVYVDGTQHWYVDDKKHRDGGKPAVIKADGTQKWYINGEKQPKPDTIMVDNVDSPVIIDESKIDVSIPFIINKYAVDYCNKDGTVTQIININSNNLATVSYQLVFNDDANKRYNHTIDIKSNDLNSITKMRVLKDDGWVIAAEVNGVWVAGNEV